MMLPRLQIRRTPANDLYLLRSRFGRDNESAFPFDDPLRAIANRRGELRFLWQLLRDWIEPHLRGSETGIGDAARPAEPPADAARVQRSRAPAAGARAIARRTSLLR